MVYSSNLPEGIKTFVIGCIHLASWIPRALVEHKITASNLKQLIFSKGDKATKQQQDKSPKAEQNNTAAEESETSPSNDESHEPKDPRGLGRLPHSAYIILVNIKGKNLASVDKYWIEKLRCALCNEFFSANIPAHVHQEKYHPSFKAMLALQNTTWPCLLIDKNIFNRSLVFPFPPLPNGNSWKN
ncbi:hypothetical protein LLB_0734 [Legionella longbeachae D-4968]|nr:hypothetical protein LLB_0734 [Legionella longbeachae D-4968]